MRYCAREASLGGVWRPFCAEDAAVGFAALRFVGVFGGACGISCTSRACTFLGDLCGLIAINAVSRCAYNFLYTLGATGGRGSILGRLRVVFRRSHAIFAQQYVRAISSSCVRFEAFSRDCAIREDVSSVSCGGRSVFRRGRREVSACSMARFIVGFGAVSCGGLDVRGKEQ